MTSVFHDLLRVQDHDTAADQLRHRRQSLPELAELARVEAALTDLGPALEAAAADRDVVAHQQRRFEDELAGVEAKIGELESRLYSGVVTAPRDLQAMQGELESLRRRRSSLEDAVLEAMAEREPLDATVEELERSRIRLDEERTRLAAAAAAAQAEIDAELTRELDARTAAAAALPVDLSSLYEQLRAKYGGIGAARLANGRCGGCHLTLPATELDRLRRQPPDTLVRCEQCGRLLVL